MTVASKRATVLSPIAYKLNVDILYIHVTIIKSYQKGVIMYTVDPSIYKGDQLNIRINKAEKQELKQFMRTYNVGLLELIRIGIETIKKES